MDKQAGEMRPIDQVPELSADEKLWLHQNVVEPLSKIVPESILTERFYQQSPEHDGMVRNFGSTKSNDFDLLLDGAPLEDVPAVRLALQASRYLRDSRSKEALSQDSEFKKILPELAVMELKKHFDDIHDKLSSPDEIALDEVKNYAARDDVGTIEKLAYEFVAKNFKKFAQLDPHGKTDKVTRNAVENGMNKFGEMEKSVNIAGGDAEIVPRLKFLQDHFDEIHTHKNFSGISLNELDFFIHRADGKENSNQSVLRLMEGDFARYTLLDSADGPRNWYTLGFTRSNAEGMITRRDIDAGLKRASDSASSAAKLMQECDAWPN